MQICTLKVDIKCCDECPIKLKKKLLKTKGTVHAIIDIYIYMCSPFWVIFLYFFTSWSMFCHIYNISDHILIHDIIYWTRSDFRGH